jgi:23S rRNA (adenine2030-N6)-methyltransferase
LSPPMPRRGLMLIDPSYEQADEYLWMPRLLGDVHRKWNVGIVVLWYPILTHGAQTTMVQSLRNAHPEGLSNEVTFPPARPGHRMIGSGLFVLNPPYGLAAEMDALNGRFASL